MKIGVRQNIGTKTVITEISMTKPRMIVISKDKNSVRNILFFFDLAFTTKIVFFFENVILIKKK